jgi:hypothetical protein
MSRTAESCFEAVDLREPLGMPRMPDAGEQPLEHFAKIADQGHVHVNVLVDLRAIDLDVDFLGFEGVGGEFAGYAIIEAHAQGDEQVRFLNGLVDPGFAVHPHHAQTSAMRGGEGSQPQKRERHRDVGLFGQGATSRSAPERMMPCPARMTGRWACAIRAAASSSAGSFGKECTGAWRWGLGAAASQSEFAGTQLGVLGDVQQHGAGAVGGRDLEGFPQAGAMSSARVIR